MLTYIIIHVYLLYMELLYMYKADITQEAANPWSSPMGAITILCHAH